MSPKNIQYRAFNVGRLKANCPDKSRRPLVLNNCNLAAVSVYVDRAIRPCRASGVGWGRRHSTQGRRNVQSKGIRGQTPFSSLAADSPQAWVESSSYRADSYCIPWPSRARYCNHSLSDRGASDTSRRGLRAGGVCGTGELRLTNLELR